MILRLFKITVCYASIFWFTSCLAQSDQLSEECQCSVDVFTGHTKKATDIYLNKNGKILFTLHHLQGIEMEESFFFFTMIKYKDDWLQVLTPYVSSGSAWVKPGNFFVATKYNGYKLYSSPWEGREIVKTGDSRIFMKVVGCCGEWIKVETNYNNSIQHAWLSPKDICSNPVSTCP